MLIASLIMLQVIIFAGLIFIFRRIMTQNVVSATQHLDELSQDYTEKEKEVARQLDEAKQKAQETVVKAQEEAEKLKSEIIKQAEQERDSLIQQAHGRNEEIIQQAEKTRYQLLAEMEERISRGAIEKACELIENTLPEEFKQLVHTRWVEDLIENGFTQLERLRMPEDVQEAKLVSAFSLDDEQRKKIAKKLKTALGRELKLKEEVDPRVVAGIVINIGSLVLDGSLKNKIHEKAK